MKTTTTMSTAGFSPLSQPGPCKPFVSGRIRGNNPAERKCRGGGYVNEALCLFRQERWPLSCGGCAWKGFSTPVLSTQSTPVHAPPAYEVPR